MDGKLVPALTTLVRRIESDVDHTKENLNQTDFLEFMRYYHDLNHGALKLLDISEGYAECMTKLGVKTKTELEELWKSRRDDLEVQNAVEKLQLAEKSLDELIAEIEKKLQSHEKLITTKNRIQAGELLPKDYSVLAIPSGQQVSLEECWKGSEFTLFVLLRLFG